LSDSKKPSSQEPDGLFPTAGEDLISAAIPEATLQTRSNAFRLAYDDVAFLLRDELRPVRLQLELLKPELLLQEQEVDATVVVFGSARVSEAERADELLAAAEEAAREAPGNLDTQRALSVAKRLAAKSRYYGQARRLGELIGSHKVEEKSLQLVVVTGGGPGIMEAANRGAADAGAKSIGLNIVLPEEQTPNPYITPELCFQFHYFALRKMHFLMRARALVVFPGGFGTLDELFDALTLIQTGKIRPMPVILVGRDYWQRVIDFQFLAHEGVIHDEDLALFDYAEDAEEAWDIICRYYDHQPEC